MPKISVIMPAYNAEKYIKTSVDSILNQTFCDFELIVINDCSNDSTGEILLSYRDERLICLNNEKNLGVARTLNRGLAAARGEYIARMDADDISEPHRLEKQLAYMEEHPQTVVCGSKITVFYETGEQAVCHYPQQDRQIKTTLLFSCPFAHPSVMIRGEVLRKQGLCYEEAFEKVEDYRLWTRLAKSGEFVNLPEPLLRYRKHPGQVCATSPQAQYEGKLRLSAELLPIVGINQAEEQRIVVDAFDGRIAEKESFRKFEELALRMTKGVPSELDKKQLRTMLKSRLIELALSQKMHLGLCSVGLVGMKAWLYVNIGGKK